MNMKYRYFDWRTKLCDTFLCPTLIWHYRCPIKFINYKRLDHVCIRSSIFFVFQVFPKVFAELLLFYNKQFAEVSVLLIAQLKCLSFESIYILQTVGQTKTKICFLILTVSVIELLLKGDTHNILIATSIQMTTNYISVMQY